MNWIKVSDQMPELKPIPGSEDKMSDAVLIWVLDTDGSGFPAVGNYSTHWEGWLADQDGPLHVWGFEVTHWTKVEPPEFSGPIAAD